MSEQLKRILVIDDEDQMRMALRETLTRAGYEVTVAFDGANGLRKLREAPQDAVLTDLRMPIMDGMQFLELAQSEFPSVPVVLMTAYATVDTAVEAMKIGAFDYLMKPFSLDAVEEVFQRLFTYRDQAVANPAPDTSDAAEKTPQDDERVPAIITQDPRMHELIELARDVASSSASVFISGESGTGKELFARMVHYAGSRANGKFVAVNCAALPENLLESELFGYEKGAFTGASSRKIGKFEQAHQGTLLLDEVTEMPLHLQAKLLRVLQESEIDRVGGTEPIQVDVRIVGTTNRDLVEAVKSGDFREDLYYRLNVIPIQIPPLRRRKDDIHLLVEHFVAKYNQRNRKNILGLSPEGMDALLRHDWHGNVRELENIIERAVVISREEYLSPGKLFLHGTLIDTPDSADGTAQRTAETLVEDALYLEVGTSVHDMERKLILRTLDECGGNRKRAAEMLGITSRTLLNKIKEYRSMGIEID